MACGDRYLSLLVTASGLHLGNPFDDIATFGDYEEWRELARRYATLAGQFHDKLGEVEGSVTPGSFPRWNAVREIIVMMRSKLADLPLFFTGNTEVSIADAQAVAFDAICAIEMSEDSILALGGTTLPIPNSPPPRDNDDLIPDVELGLGAGVALVGGALLLGFILSR